MSDSSEPDEPSDFYTALPEIETGKADDVDGPLLTDSIQATSEEQLSDADQVLPVFWSEEDAGRSTARPCMFIAVCVYAIVVTGLLITLFLTGRIAL